MKDKKRSRGDSAAEKFSELVLARRHDRAVEYATKHGSVGTAACQQLPSGESLLHVTARTRGTPVQLIDVLVRRGSCVNAADARGARPLHVAAGGEAVRAIFAAASAHGQEVDRDAVDATGLSVADAVAWTLRDDEALAESDGEEERRQERQRVIAAHEGDPRANGGSDAAWGARLRDEIFDEMGAFDSACDAFGWAGDGGFGEAEVEGDWFSEIEAAAAARVAAAARAAREKAEAFAAQRDAERNAERGKWQAAAHEAEAEQRRREAETTRRAAEARSRAAALAAEEEVAEGRARYLAAWAALGARADSAAPLRLRDVPWPRRAPPSAPGGDEAEASFSVEEVATRVFDASMDGAARRRAVQAELRRWHPDKFVGRWGSRVLPEEREVLLLRIKQVAQCLTELLNRPG